jgi:type VI protein secretion system component Hcp
MAIRYFLLIDGLDGGSTDAKHAGWFAINNFAIDLSNTAGTGTGGAAAGVATFSPLTVDSTLIRRWRGRWRTLPRASI